MKVQFESATVRSSATDLSLDLFQLDTRLKPRRAVRQTSLQPSADSSLGLRKRPRLVSLHCDRRGRRRERLEEPDQLRERDVARLELDLLDQMTHSRRTELRKERGASISKGTSTAATSPDGLSRTERTRAAIELTSIPISLKPPWTTSIPALTPPGQPRTSLSLRPTYSRSTSRASAGLVSPYLIRCWTTCWRVAEMLKATGLQTMHRNNGSSRERVSRVYKGT